MSAQRRASVVVPTYQRRESVRRLLEALAHQTLPPDQFEVIISVDGSDDGTREMVETLAMPYRLVGLWQPNRGRAAACNAGLRASEGELVVLLDDDMEPAPGFLAAHLEAHARGVRLGVVGAAPVLIEPMSPPIVDYIGSKFNRHLETLSEPGHQFRLRDFYSGNFSIPRQTLLDVGGLDEAFTEYGNEDLELSHRLAAAGVHLVFSPDAVARQHYTKEFPALARDNLAKGRTAVLLASKHAETLAQLKLSGYHDVSPRWRMVRAALLASTRVWRGTMDVAMRFMGWLERRRPARMRSYYYYALDYFYWVGARDALRENRRAGRGLRSLAGAAEPPDS
jgi:GT2 family glycosyltransferase